MKFKKQSRNNWNNDFILGNPMKLIVISKRFWGNIRVTHPA